MLVKNGIKMLEFDFNCMLQLPAACEALASSRDPQVPSGSGIDGGVKKGQN